MGSIARSNGGGRLMWPGGIIEGGGIETIKLKLLLIH